ncbi:hypothetical protein ES703_119227 [subsurface metagenome]
MVEGVGGSTGGGAGGDGASSAGAGGASASGGVSAPGSIVPQPLSATAIARMRLTIIMATLFISSFTPLFAVYLLVELPVTKRINPQNILNPTT